jgi:hypothetical protein
MKEYIKLDYKGMLSFYDYKVKMVEPMKEYIKLDYKFTFCVFFPMVYGL